MDLGERGGSERSQLAAAPPDGVVPVGGAHVKEAFPGGRLADHAQLPVLTVPDKHLHRNIHVTAVRWCRVGMQVCAARVSPPSSGGPC